MFEFEAKTFLFSVIGSSLSKKSINPPASFKMIIPKEHPNNSILFASNHRIYHKQRKQYLTQRLPNFLIGELILLDTFINSLKILSLDLLVCLGPPVTISASFKFFCLKL